MKILILSLSVFLLCQNSAFASSCDVAEALFSSKNQIVQTTAGNKYATYREACSANAILITKCNKHFYKCVESSSENSRKDCEWVVYTTEAGKVFRCWPTNNPIPW